MHPQHEHQINDRYSALGVSSWQAQLDWAIAAALTTRGKTAEYWVDEAEQLVGRIALCRAGGTFRDALRFLDPGHCPCVEELHLQVPPEEVQEPSGRGATNSQDRP
jgi:hypothetical protein